MSGQQEPRSERASSPGRTVDARQLWSGGAATAVVAALIALAGILVCRWLFNIPVLAPRQDGAWGDASTAGYAIAAAAAALVATAIMHLLLIAAPRPRMFFAWIIGLATVIAVVYRALSSPCACIRSGPNIFGSNSPRDWPWLCSPDSEPPLKTTRSAASSANDRYSAMPALVGNSNGIRVCTHPCPKCPYRDAPW